MLHILWEYRVGEEKRPDFERHYSSHGTWAELFRRASGYRGTTLLRDPKDRGRYLTIDVWEDAASFHRFKTEFAAAYAALDKHMEALTESERHLGTFDSV
ncbi:MAG: antibiotic biosynthesis monooxygenase family protein [Terriglobales bacterium]